MNHPRLSVLLITALFCCILIPAGTAAEPSALPQNTIILPDSSGNIRPQPDWHAMFCSLPKETVICGPDTLFYRYTVDPGATKLDITLSWDAPQKHNPLKLQLTAPNGETFGPYNDQGRIGKIHKELSASSFPSGEWIIAVTQTAEETTHFSLTIT